jgi:cyclopropane-fatty-acyl-phospholipid synthase
MLPSKESFCEQAARAKLGVGNILEFGHDYAWTLEQWYKNFMAIRDKLIADNYSPVFLRAWEFYLSFSIAGFNSGKTNVMQVELLN